MSIALPVSNADVGMTIAAADGPACRSQWRTDRPGDVRSAAQRHHPEGADGTIVSKPAANGLQTVVKFQRVLTQRYFDVAGFPGRTVGLDAEDGKQKTAGK